MFSGLASFSLRFPLVFLHFPYLSFVFHRFSLFFIGFPLVLLQFPHFSVVFHRFSLVFLGFPCFFHCFACISSLFHCFASFRCVFIGLIAFSSFLCVFYFNFLSCFAASCVFHGFFGFILHFPHCFVVFTLDMFHWFSCFIGFLASSCILWFFPALVFVHCPHSFLLQLMWLVLVVVVVVGGGGGGCCCFGAFMYFLWSDG